MPSTIGIVASGEDVFNDAVFWVDAGRSSVVSGALSNLGTGGSALNAVFGNSTGVDSFDPALLTHTGTNYLYLPGVAGNYATTPNSAALQITNDLDIRALIAFDSWIPSAAQMILSKWNFGTQKSYRFLLTNTGRLQFDFTTDGVTDQNRLSTAAVSFSAGQIKWVRVTLDVDNGSGGHTVTFYTSDDQITWTQLGTPITTAGVVSLFAGTTALDVGSTGSSSANASAKLYRAIVRNGIGGTIVFDADFTTGITSGAQTTFTESSTNAATVTINRSTSGRKAAAVTRPILLFGTDDYLEVADNDLLDFGASDSFTVLLVHRAWATFATSAAGVAKKANATATTQGWLLSAGSTTAAQGQMQVGDGTNGTTAVSGSRTSGALSIVTAVRDVTADTVQTFLGNAGGTAITDATTTTSANAEVMRVGRLSGAGTGYSDFEVIAAAVWRRALNANEIATIVARYT